MRFSHWLQISANLAIIIGLILVGLQMQQNTDLLRLQLLKDEAASYTNGELAVIGEDYGRIWEKAVLNPGELTLGEMRIEDAFLYGHGLSRWISTYNLAERGLVTKEQWQMEVKRDARSMLGHPFGRAWWDVMYETLQLDDSDVSYFPRELFDFVQAELEQNPTNYAEKRYEKIKLRVEKYLTTD